MCQIYLCISTLSANLNAHTHTHIHTHTHTHTKTHGAGRRRPQRACRTRHCAQQLHAPRRRLHLGNFCRRSSHSSHSITFIIVVVIITIFKICIAAPAGPDAAPRRVPAAGCATQHQRVARRQQRSHPRDGGRAIGAGLQRGGRAQGPLHCRHQRQAGVH